MYTNIYIYLYVILTYTTNIFQFRPVYKKKKLFTNAYIHIHIYIHLCIHMYICL